jgi:hypothetical protein
MKIVVGFLMSLVLVACGSTDGDNFGEYTTIEAETQFNFGEVIEGEVIEVSFDVKNTGKVPLTIIDVKPSCGCTVAQYTKDPILPGETGVIETKVDSKGFKGTINKTITMMANTTPTRTVFSITGEVVMD